MKIKKIIAREVIDSRGRPTVEVELTTDKLYRAIVPSGASTGKHEAIELRDGGDRFCGLGVQKAVKNVNNIISKKIKGKKLDPQEIDDLLIRLDGTENKSRLGANAILAVSMAVHRASNDKLYNHIAKLAGSKLSIPMPMMNIINGGKHAGNGLDIQEFMIIPGKAKKFSEALRMSCEVYYTLQGIIKEKYGKTATNVGDEGGFAPPINQTSAALDMICSAIEEAGYTDKIKIGIDAAASSFFKEKYSIEGKSLSPEDLCNYYLDISKKYPVVSIEDGFAEDDWNGFSLLTKIWKKQVVGDDLLVTNTSRIEQGIIFKSCNALLLKVNQIGTVSEAIAAFRMAKKSGWNVVVSHRSGETEDTFIADLSVGLGCGQIKSGAPCRSERTAKYNQLLRLEEELGRKARLAKPNYF